MAKDNSSFFKSKNRWSEIKDDLLGCYLRPYFQKVLMTGKPIFYVDCFAGKGKFDDGKPGSPVIALESRDYCLTQTTLKNKSAKIDACFIDLHHTEELNQNIAHFNNSHGSPTVISGKYEETIETLLSCKRGNNVFLYIDPYGIRALDSALFDKFNSYGFHSLEMLINFNSFGFFRDACRMMKVDYRNDEALKDLDDLVEYEPTEITASPQSEDLLTRIAGGDYWKAIVNDYKQGNINGYQAEKRLSNEYKHRLKQKYNYVLDMPIRLKPKQRPKYRMIHICNHEDGCFLMAQNMQRRKDDLFIKIQQNGQLMFSDINKEISSTAENELMTIDSIKEKLKEHLAKFENDIGLTEFLATFLNDYGLLCEFKVLYALLDELKGSKYIGILRTPPFTEKGKPTVFWEETKEKKIIIRKCK